MLVHAVALRTVGDQNENNTKMLTNVGMITSLQWNPHFECFLTTLPPKPGEPTCADGMKRDLTEILTSQGIDFANIVMMPEEEVYDAPKGFVTIKSHCEAPDDVRLLYNSALWAPVGAPKTNLCMAKTKRGSDRANLVQRFKSKSEPDFQVTVLAAHFPHPHNFFDGVHVLKAALKGDNLIKKRDGRQIVDDNVLVIADANVPKNRPPSWIIMKDLEVNAKEDTTITTDPALKTCCQDSDYHKMEYDRIFANFGTEMTSVMLDQPSWVPRSVDVPGIGHREVFAYHKAVIGALHL